MDKSVPAGAAMLLDFIRETEVGTAARSGYDVIYGHNQGKLPKPVTAMTIAELQGHQRKGWPAKSTASGGYQFMRATLTDLRKELGLRDTQVFDPDLQDRLGFHLLRRRGYDEFMAGKISRTEFGKRLAQEWASFPVLVACKGAHRQIARGQSYYAGDGLNKALVKPAAVEVLLDRVKVAGGAIPAPDPVQPKPVPIPTPVEAPKSVDPIPVPPPPPLTPTPPRGSARGIWALILALLIGLWIWLISLPCEWLGLFCGG